MVSKFGHCLNDLLFRWSIGSLQIDIPAIVSNHRDLEPLARQYGIPFHHIPVTADTKAEAEAQLLALVRELDVDLVVLARYMQVLSDEVCKELDGQVDQHPPQLPAELQGSEALPPGVRARREAGRRDRALRHARPRRGPDHRAGRHAGRPRLDSADQLVAAGRDVECQVLSRAVRWHAETRILRHGHRTVVFR